jgi:hypothetical protein
MRDVVGVVTVSSVRRLLGELGADILLSASPDIRPSRDDASHLSHQRIQDPSADSCETHQTIRRLEEILLIIEDRFHPGQLV